MIGIVKVNWESRLILGHVGKKKWQKLVASEYNLNILFKFRLLLTVFNFIVGLVLINEDVCRLLTTASQNKIIIMHSRPSGSIQSAEIYLSSSDKDKVVGRLGSKECVLCERVICQSK